jgi:hypothetical protein
MMPHQNQIPVGPGMTNNYLPQQQQGSAMPLPQGTMATQQNFGGMPHAPPPAGMMMMPNTVSQMAFPHQQQNNMMMAMPGQNSTPAATSPKGNPFDFY